VSTGAAEHESSDVYAEGVANSSYEWYRSHAIRSRRLHKFTELALLIISAAVPLAGLLDRTRSLAPSVLGAIVFILVGFRTIFHWHENYLRFSQARESVEAQRRLFRTRARPYDNPDDRAQVLVAEITRIEKQEMANWLKTVSPPAGSAVVDGGQSGRKRSSP
jgi:hypothetical protein